MTTRVLVTGASGFVGRAVVAELVARGVAVTAAMRRAQQPAPSVRIATVGNLDATTEWSDALSGCDVVIHCAARVHVMNETLADPIAAFREANVAGSVRLAEQAAAAGVRRLIYVSSIKVNGESTPPGTPFTEQSTPSPSDPYGISKWEAEQQLAHVAELRGLELVVIRPPLVYGPGVKANFLAMMRWLERGVPLPLGAITSNRRTLVGLDNLVDLLILCTMHPSAAGQTFLAGDGHDLSTTELLRRTAAALDVVPRLLPVPEAVLAAAAALVGRRAQWQRLAGSLQASIANAQRRLAWVPRVSVDDGLRRTVGDRSNRADQP